MWLLVSGHNAGEETRKPGVNPSGSSCGMAVVGASLKVPGHRHDYGFQNEFFLSFYPA